VTATDFGASTAKKKKNSEEGSLRGEGGLRGRGVERLVGLVVTRAGIVNNGAFFTRERERDLLGCGRRDLVLARVA